MNTKEETISSEDIIKLKDKLKDKRVLFVDDEVVIRKVTYMFLQKLFKEVVVCEDGEDGLDTYKKDRGFDLIITDVIMPRLRGDQMIEKIRDMDSEIKVIFVTAARIKHKQNDIFISKPISFERLCEVLDDIL